MYSNKPAYVGIVSRPKLIGSGNHWGVQLADGTVAHLTQAGEQIVSLEEFSQGLPLKQIKAAKPQHFEQITQRAKASIQSPGEYRLLDRNCETYANELIGEKPQSPQVMTAAAILASLALFHFA
jgi:hypothetical protein